MRVEIQATHVEDQDGNQFYQINLDILNYHCAFDIPFNKFSEVRKLIEELFSPEIALDKKLDNIDEIISQIQTLVIFDDFEFLASPYEEVELTDEFKLWMLFVNYAILTSAEQLVPLSLLSLFQFRKYIKSTTPNLN